MKNSNVFRENLRRLRLAAGFTQEELALRSGLSQGYINQLESGKRKFTQKSLEMITEALSVPIFELFREAPVPRIREPERPAGRPRRRRTEKKEVMALLDELPEDIMEHYLVLLRLEKEARSRE